MARRLLLLVVLLMGLTALAAGIAPRESSETSRPSQPRQPAVAAPAARPQTVTHRLRTDGDVGRQRVVAAVGDTVRLTVAGDVTDAVALRGLERREGFELIEPIDRDTPAVFDLVADAPGDYAVALVEADRVVGVLHVKSDR